MQLAGHLLARAAAPCARTRKTGTWCPRGHAGRAISRHYRRPGESSRGGCDATCSPPAVPETALQHLSTAALQIIPGHRARRATSPRLGKQNAKPPCLGRETPGRYSGNIDYSGEQPSLVKEDAFITQLHNASV